MQRVVEFFQQKSIFVFTSDIEWSPEWAIKELFEIFDKKGIPLTPFITHESEMISEYYKDEKASHVGLHPNFLANSSHGNGVKEVVDYVCGLWSQSNFFRSHTFFDHYQVTEQFVNKGFLFDSNLCLFMHPLSSPLAHQSGLIRFPVYWEDDIHWNRELPFEMKKLQFCDALKKPGLKVFNVHPLNVALNISTKQGYQDRKFIFNESQRPDDIDAYRYEGAGVKTFLQEVLEYVVQEGAECMYLDDLYNKLFVSKIFD